MRTLRSDDLNLAEQRSYQDKDVQQRSYEDMMFNKEAIKQQNSKATKKLSM